MAGAIAVAAPAGATNYNVTIHQTHTSVDLGQGSVFYGSVYPRVPGKTVVLQRFSAGTWKTIASEHLDSSSAYSFTITPKTTPGTFKYRAGYAYWVSPTASLTSYKWHYLSDLDGAEQGGCGFDREQSEINGGFYIHSIVMTDFCGESTAYGEWSLKRACATVDVHMGLTDDASSDSRASFEVIADAVPKYNAIISFGHSAHFIVGVSGYLRIRLQETAVQGTNVAGFGNAKIRCTW